ncbi:ammonium transporter AmtB [Aethina tumida]|uniref:ammonium transporter AmtB n=1 Tax=Aethina tumida TaxID=116153 RepID=UPI002147C56C|nr:ammonium transporter AmtB [Aethina tumida]XP_049822799.1 ammonium transporter AmtB [Aethina tumida]
MGFIMIEAACVPVHSVLMILVKNTIAIATAILAFIIIGVPVTTAIEYVTQSPSSGSWWSADVRFIPETAQGLLAALMGTGIICASLSGRLHLFALIVCCTLYAGIFQPLVMFGTWSGDGIYFEISWGKMSYAVRDFGGLISIHLPAALISSIGLFFLGRRLIVLRNLDPLSVGLESTGRAVLGYTFVTVGTIAFEMPNILYINPLFESELIALIAVNNILAIGMSLFVVLICHAVVYHRQIFTYWTFVRTLQSVYAGVITVSGGVDQFTPQHTTFITAVSAILYFITIFSLHELSYEDNCSVVAIHLVCGSFGNLCTGIFCAQDFGWNIGHESHVLYQFLAWLFTFILVSVTMLVTFSLLSCFKLLRGESEERHHLLAVNANKILKRKCYKRLFSLSRRRRRYLEPATILRIIQHNSPFKPMESIEVEPLV